MNTGHNAYRETNTMGMSQLELILTVYRGAIGFLDQAKSDFDAGELKSGRTACEKARKCIVHLYTTLDMEKGEDIAAQLGQPYAFMIEQIDLAMANKSCELLDEVGSMLKTIREGWEGLRQQETPSIPSGSRESEAVIDGKGKKAASKGPSDGKRLTISA